MQISIGYCTDTEFCQNFYIIFPLYFFRWLVRWLVCQALYFHCCLYWLVNFRKALGRTDQYHQFPSGLKHWCRYFHRQHLPLQSIRFENFIFCDDYQIKQTNSLKANWLKYKNWYLKDTKWNSSNLLFRKSPKHCNLCNIMFSCETLGIRYH